MRQRKGTVGHEQPGDIGADRIESHEPKIEKTSDPDLKIEPHAHEREKPDGQKNLTYEITGIEREQSGKQQGGCKECPTDPLSLLRGHLIDARSDPIAAQQPDKRADGSDQKDDNGSAQRQPRPGVEQVVDWFADPAIRKYRTDEFLEQPCQ